MVYYTGQDNIFRILYKKGMIYRILYRTGHDTWDIMQGRTEHIGYYTGQDMIYMI